VVSNIYQTGGNLPAEPQKIRHHYALKLFIHPIFWYRYGIDDLGSTKMKNNLKLPLILLAVISANCFADRNYRYYLKDSFSNLKIEIVATKPISEDYLRSFAERRNLVLESFASPSTLTGSWEASSLQLEAISAELSNMLGDGITVQVMKPHEMQLATQAGGQPGNIGK
jgi:hypothetical protein